MSRSLMDPEQPATQSPSTVVVQELADHRGVDPVDLDQPLFEVIDTDALDNLVGDHQESSASEDVVVTFSYEGCRVRVAADGSVEISPTGTE